MSETIRALTHVQREIEKLVQAQGEHIVSGRPDSFDDYRHICGVILGLNYANQIINDLVQKMEKDDD